jgi:hypothetical protein
MADKTTSIACAVLLMALSAGAPATGTDTYPEDCFNDAVPQRNDLEPPPPPGADADADLFRVTDEDVKALLADIAAAEQRRLSGTSQRRD